MRPGYLIALVAAVLVGLGLGSYASEGQGLRSPVMPRIDLSRGVDGPVVTRGLSQPADRSFPAPSTEEAAGRLAPVVVPSVASSRYAVQLTQDDGVSPLAWSPCRPVHYVVNPTGAPAGFADDVAVVIAEVSAATGLVFVDDGTTDEPPARDRADFAPERYGDRWSPVLIAFATDDDVPELAGAAGLALTSARHSTGTGIGYYVSGWAYLSTDLIGQLAHDGAPAHLPVLRHELGHVVGLDHVDDPRQLMYVGANALTRFQLGDLSGLAALGDGQCAPGI